MSVAARERFTAEIQADPIDLGRTVLWIAQEAYPDLDVEEYWAALDEMAAELQERLPPERYPMRILKTLNHYLFEDLGFRGNREDYYDPRNSFLNEVIDRRLGIPITLSLLYLELARRVDFPMAGVSMPGHFLVRPLFEGSEILVDPFHEGEILFAEDCQERLTQIYGPGIRLQEQYLAPTSSRMILVRLLNNLKHIYLSRTELEPALAAVERILLLLPEDLGQLRDRGLLYYQLGDWQQAQQDLKHYLTQAPQYGETNRSDAHLIREILQRLESYSD
ncbi:MAG: transglutaminase-like domain-containing protein [Thermostichus sp. DG02_5_bins_236]